MSHEKWFLGVKTLLLKLDAASETEVVDRLSSHTGCTRELRSFIQFAVRRPALSELEEKLLASRTGRQKGLADGYSRWDRSRKKLGKLPARLCLLTDQVSRHAVG